MARLVSPMLVTLVAAVAINVSGLSPHVPGFVGSMARSLGVCAVPIGLVMTGVNLADYLDEPSKLFHLNVAAGACAVRLRILPALMLCLAPAGCPARSS
jgi:malate permease and related proteins